MRSFFFAIFLIGTAAADEPPSPVPIVAGVRESQVTVSLERGGKKTQFQATVIGKTESTVTVLTAGHGLGPSDVGMATRLLRENLSVEGRIESVARNPYYRPGLSTDIPGADNAVARLRLDRDGSLPLESLRAAEMVEWHIPEPSGQTVQVQMVDQFGGPHIVKAGNYSNPRWLEWGPSYRPVPGDSGSGVFVVRRRPDGGSGPILIGVVVDRSTRGGGASLIHRKERWVDSALKSSPTPP